MTKEETVQLIKLAKQGDEDAKTELVKANYPLIKSIVRRYKYKQIEYDDLMSLGLLGLVKAINNFDLSYDVRFSTYAVPMIAGEIKRFIRDDGAIKVSRNTKSMSLKISKFVEEYRQKHCKEPQVEDIADAFSITPQEVVFIMDSAKYPISIYSETEEDGVALLDKIPAKGTFDEKIDITLLNTLIEELNPRDRLIVEMRYYQDKTQGEIAQRLGVSQVQVSRLEAKIIEKLRKELL